MHAGSIQVRLLGILVIGVVCSLIACSGGGSAASPPPTAGSTITLVVSPGTTEISTGATLKLTATLAGASTPAISWSVDGIPNGNATVGTITGTGSSVTYTAPAAPGVHSIKATDSADTTKSAFSVITVQDGIVLLLSPSITNLPLAGTLSLTASISGTTNTAVIWSVDGVTNGNAAVGVITGSGGTVTYTAPSNPGPHTVKVTSVVDSTKFSTASLLVSDGSVVNLGPPAAFPGCEGMGCGATGGRGGDVYTVNTLEDSVNPGVLPQNGPNGPTCSLRDAMLKKGPRTIVFSVAGTITLHSSIYPVPPNLTIAGQTAPGGGIQIRGDGTFGSGGAMLWINGNSIVRYLRLRPGDAPVNASYQGLTAITISAESSNDVVIDHSSFQWDGNKAVSYFSDAGVQRCTFSWNLDAEGLAAHSTGIIIGGYVMGQTNLDQSSWDGHHNVFATLDHRMPYTNLKYGRWINNLTFGYGYASLIRGGTQFDIIGNVYDGITSGIKVVSSKNEVRWADTLAHNENVLLPSGTAQIYMANNFGPNNPTGALDNFTSMLRTASSENGQLDDNVIDSKFKATRPTIPSSLNKWPITIATLAARDDLKKLLTPTVGAYRRLAADGSWVMNRDPVDARVVAYIMNPANSPTALVPTAGPYPTLSAGAAVVDSDGDGMPDVWEDAHGLDKHDASDRNTIRPNANGYNNLELYLSGLYPNGTPLP